MQTLKIEVRVHFGDTNDDKEKLKVVEDACRLAAQQVLGTAILLSGKSKPEAKFITEDYIEGVTVHDIAPPDGS